jgi:hypothetical protein
MERSKTSTAALATASVCVYLVFGGGGGDGVSAQCASVIAPFIGGGALTYENLFLFDGGKTFSNASGTAIINGIPEDATGVSVTRCKYEFVGPKTTSRIQLRFIRSTLGNNSVVILQDGEANPFSPSVGVFYGLSETLPAFVGSSTGNQGRDSPMFKNYS